MVFKVQKKNNYTAMSNHHLRDKNLSFKAKGLLSMMLSLPDDWDYSVNGLVQICRESESAVKSTLKELKDAGYVIVSKHRTSSGTFEYEYSIYELPQCGEPQVENPQVDEPQVENQPQINKDNKTKEYKKETTNVVSKKVEVAKLVTLTPEEQQKLIDKLGLSIYEDFVERLSLWKLSYGKKTKSDYYTILNWERREKQKKQYEKKYSIDSTFDALNEWRQNG